MPAAPGRTHVGGAPVLVRRRSVTVAAAARLPLLTLHIDDIIDVTTGALVSQSAALEVQLPGGQLPQQQPPLAPRDNPWAGCPFAVDDDDGSDEEDEEVARASSARASAAAAPSACARAPSGLGGASLSRREPAAAAAVTPSAAAPRSSPFAEAAGRSFSLSGARGASVLRLPQGRGVVKLETSHSVVFGREAEQLHGSGTLCVSLGAGSGVANEHSFVLHQQPGAECEISATHSGNAHSGGGAALGAVLTPAAMLGAAVIVQILALGLISERGLDLDLGVAPFPTCAAAAAAAAAAEGAAGEEEVDGREAAAAVPLSVQAAAGAARPEGEGALPYEGRRAVVVGGGPAGATAAMYLARAGFAVDVFERLPEPSRMAADKRRAYMIALTERGQAALTALGINLSAHGQAHTSGAICLHTALGTHRLSCAESSVGFTRADLTQMLIDEARSRYPSQITFHFGAKLAGVDLEGQVATFEVISSGPTSAAALGDVSSGGGAGTLGDGVVGAKTEAAAARSFPYDLIVGADGANSQVRAAMQAADPSLRVDVADSGREYLTFHSIPPAPGIEPSSSPAPSGGETGANTTNGAAGAAAGAGGGAGQGAGAGQELHLFASGDPRAMLSAHRSCNDPGFSGMVALEAGGFDQLVTPADFEAMLKAKFRQAPAEWVPLVAAQLSAAKAAAGRPSSVGKRIRVSRLDGRAAILVGDAAHGVTPVHGQGANSALESCAVLGAALSRAAADAAAAAQARGSGLAHARAAAVAAVPAAFDAARRADAHALAALDEKAHALFESPSLFNADFRDMVGHVSLGLLSRLMPGSSGRRGPPELLQIGSTLPYSDIVRAMDRDARAAKAVGQALAGAVAAVGLHSFAGAAAAAATTTGGLPGL